MTFSHKFFKVRFPSESVVRCVPVRPMEGTVFASIPLVWIFFQMWRSSYPRFVFHLGQDLMYRNGELGIVLSCHSVPFVGATCACPCFYY
ncbi:unnamed protein product [Prunus armeniaca]